MSRAKVWGWISGGGARPLCALLIATGAATAPLLAQAEPGVAPQRCADWTTMGRNPTPEEIRCRYGIRGTGRFGLADHMDVPVYQTDSPMPGTHVVGVPGLPAPSRCESYEEWERRILLTTYGPEVRVPRRDLESLHPILLEKVIRLERRLAEAGVSAQRRETWRSPARQAWLFQHGRVRRGPLATATLTSWHSHVDESGQPAGRALDYDVPTHQLRRFHEIVEEVGLYSYGADSNDPWHVYWDTGATPAEELALLRLLPRVPHVTLATGRPYGDPGSNRSLPELRQEVERFVLPPPKAVPLGGIVQLPCGRLAPDLAKVVLHVDGREAERPE